MISKTCVILFCGLMCVLASDKYTDKYDNLDLNEIIGNKRLLQAYVNCVMERGKCSPEGKELKEHLVEALDNGCEKCTEAQKKGATTMIDHLIKNESEIWKELTAKFDSTGKYRKKYEDEAKARGIVIPEK